MFGKRRDSSPTVGRSKQPRRAILKSMYRKFGKEIEMNPEIHTTLLNTYPPKLMAVLKALREQLKENDQLNAVEEIAGPVPQSPS